MRSDVSSAMWAYLQRDNPDLCEIITLMTDVGTYLFTTNNKPIMRSDGTYNPFPVGATKGAEESVTLQIGTVGFSIVNTGDFGRLARAGLLNESEVLVRRCPVNSPNLGSVSLFRGKLADIMFDRNKISGTARNAFQSANINWPYYTYMDTCVWKFGSTGCGLNVSSYTMALAIDASSSNPIQLLVASGTLTQSFAPGQLERGRVTIITGQNSGQVRAIRVHTGDMLLLSHTLPYAPTSGDQLHLQRGCRKRFETDCTSQYNNANRFLGASWMPRQEQAF